MEMFPVLFLCFLVIIFIIIHSNKVSSGFNINCKHVKKIDRNICYHPEFNRSFMSKIKKPDCKICDYFDKCEYQEPFERPKAPTSPYSKFSKMKGEKLC